MGREIKFYGVQIPLPVRLLNFSRGKTYNEINAMEMQLKINLPKENEEKECAY